MINRLFLIFTIGLGSISSFAQDNLEPRILILSPNEVIADKKSQKQLDLYQESCVKSTIDYYKNKSDSLIQFISNNDSIQNNFKEHYINQIKHANKLDYSNIISYNKANTAQQYLSIELPNVVVKFSDLKSNGEIKSLKEIADSHNVSFIVNIPVIEYYYDKKTIVAKPRIQLYDCIANEILIDDSGELSEYGNSTTKCEYLDEKIIIQHAGIMEYSMLLNKIKSSNPKSERFLEKKRIEILDSLYTLNKDFQSIKQILTDNLQNINIDPYYIGISNNDKSKFIAFFAYEIPTTWSKTSSDYMLTIYSGKLENDKWVIEKETQGSRVDGLNKLSSIKRLFFINLHKIDFFIENSIEFNQEFWNNELFKNDRTIVLIM